MQTELGLGVIHPSHHHQVLKRSHLPGEISLDVLYGTVAFVK